MNFTIPVEVNNDILYCQKALRHYIHVHQVKSSYIVHIDTYWGKSTKKYVLIRNKHSPSAFTPLPKIYFQVKQSLCVDGNPTNFTEKQQSRRDWIDDLPLTLNKEIDFTFLEFKWFHKNFQLFFRFIHLSHLLLTEIDDNVIGIGFYEQRFRIYLDMAKFFFLLKIQGFETIKSTDERSFYR